MQFEFITNQQQFEDLASAWGKLSSESAAPYQFFQEWYWVSSWWQTLAPLGNYELKILVATHDNTIVMIWPWVVNQHYGLQILEPMGGLLSCFDDALIIDAQENQGILGPAWNFILENADVDAIELRAVHARANIAPLISNVGGEPIKTTSAPFVDTQAHDSFEAYLASRTKKMRQNQRRSAKYLGEQGELSGNGDDHILSADFAIDTCLSFKSQWLTARGLSGKTMLTNEACVFLKQVCNHYKQHSENAGLCISSLLLDEKYISIGIGFRYHNNHYEYLGGFDYRLERFGPGRLRMEYGIRDCFEKGISGYNMLTPATSFKKIWTEESSVVQHYIIPITVRGKFYRNIYMRKLRPQLKRVYKALPPIIRTKVVPSILWR